MVLGIIVILVVIGGFAYTVPVVPITVQEPYETVETYEVQEPYDVIETYEEQEPYTVEVPYTVDVTVTKSQMVCDFYTSLGALTFKTEDFYLTTSKSCKIVWSSTEEVNLFAVLTDQAWNSFYTNLIIKLGLPAVLTLVSGGTLSPLTVGVMLTALPDVVNILSDENYYEMNSEGDYTTKHFNAGSYKIFVLKAGGSGSLNADITYDYETTETETRYRTETKYRTVTKTRTVTKYRTVDKTRIVNKYRDVEKRITLFEYLTG